MKDQIQKQEGGDNSNNFQGQNLTVYNYNRLSESQVKVIALQVFEDNFIKLKGDAFDVAFKRFDEITNKILSILISNNPVGIQRFNEPAIQYSLFNVQKEYAISGDKDLSKLLIHLFLQRLDTEERSTAQIALDEAIKIIPKLTNFQLNGMALNYSMTRPFMSSIEERDRLSEFFNDYLPQFLNNEAISRYDCTHIVSLGCGILSQAHYNPVSMFFREHYSGFFQKGLDQNSLQQISAIEGLNTLIMECFHNHQKKQLRILNQSELKTKFEYFNVQANERVAVNDIFSKSIMGVGPLEDYLKTISENINKLNEEWDSSELLYLELTSLGSTIASAYIKSKENR